MVVDIFGASSEIAKKLKETLGYHDKIERINLLYRSDIDFSDISINNLFVNLNIESDYYVFCVGKLYSKRINEQSVDEINQSVNINLLSIIRITDYLLEINEKARVIIVGSESGSKGSYDTTYFLCKAALKAYVRERCISYKEQQLLLISPSVIDDAAMTTKRSDRDQIEKNRNEHPKRRLLKSEEVTTVISNIILSNCNYLSNTEIEINGGKFSRMKYK